MSYVRQAVILVAGDGKRLRPFTLTQPKCFARVNGVRILDNALSALSERGHEAVTIVVGHMADLIRTTVGAERHGMKIVYVENADYGRTNSMYSLALGLRAANAACWVVEGDVFFESAILEFRPVGEISWLVDSCNRSLDGAYVESSADGVARSLAIVRDLSLLKPAQKKSIGMLCLTDEGRRILLAWLETAIAEQRTNSYYDMIIGDRLTATNSVRTLDVAGHKWFEIDNQNDLMAAEALFARGQAQTDS